MTLEEALARFDVHPPGSLPYDAIPGWWGVSDAEAGGIVAYFGEEIDACRYRLAEVNRALNG